jgi:hypothetical protein
VRVPVRPKSTDAVESFRGHLVQFGGITVTSRTEHADAQFTNTQYTNTQYTEAEHAGPEYA